MLLITASQLYKGPAIDEARERYATVGAERVGVEAVAVLSAAIAVRNSVDYAVQRKLYFDPMDYVSAKLAVEPVMVALPQITTVELAFIGRNESLMVRRRDGGQGEGSTSQVLVQSDVPDCIEKLGTLGCLQALPAREQPWYDLGLTLADGPFSTQPAFRWVDAPGFVERVKVLAANSTEKLIAKSTPRREIAWDPAYSLVFRTVFPGTGGTLSLIGRVTMEVSSLNNNRRLVDEARLGVLGKIYICDHRGILIGAANEGEQVLMRSGTGRIRFRSVWELSEPWAQSLSAADFPPGKQKSFTAEGFQIVLAPLKGNGMGHFSVLTVAEKGPFTDDTLEGLGATSETVIILPYPMALFLGFAYWVYSECKKRTVMKRVHPDGTDDASVLATMSSAANNPRRFRSSNTTNWGSTY